MGKHSRKCSAVEVASVDPAKVGEPGGECILAIDVAKKGMKAGFADGAGRVMKLVRFEHPEQTPAFLELVGRVVGRGVKVRATMEPTGSYGDALRYQLRRLGVEVRRVSANRTYHEAIVYDGQYSWHDGKSVCVIAALEAQGRSQPWEPRPAEAGRLGALTEQRAAHELTLEQYTGRMEGKLARYWPEIMGHWNCVSVLRVLAKYGGPGGVAAQVGQVREQLRKESRGLLSEATIELVVGSACRTLGEPMDQSQEQALANWAKEMLRLWRLVNGLDQELAKAVVTSESGRHLAELVGVALAAAILAAGLDPRSYERAGGLEKAMGLSLRERSSGKHQGQLKITKQGPGCSC